MAGVDDPVDGIPPPVVAGLVVPALLVTVAAVAAAIMAAAGRGRHRAARGPVPRSPPALPCSGAAYAVTPYTAGGPEGMPLLVGADSRYVVPALALAAAIGAWVAGASRWGAVAFAGAGLLAVLHGVDQAAGGEITGAQPSTRDRVGACGPPIVLAGAAWTLRTRLRRFDWNGVRPALIVGVLLACGCGPVAGNQVQEEFNESRFRGGDPAVDVVIDASGEPRRVGLTGVWTDAGISPILPSFGPRFENTVEYVGPIEQEMQQRYDTRAEFADALENGDYDFLIVGRGRPELRRRRS